MISYNSKEISLIRRLVTLGRSSPSAGSLISWMVKEKFLRNNEAIGIADDAVLSLLVYPSSYIIMLGDTSILKC